MSARSRITVLRHGAGRWEVGGSESVATVDRLKSSAASGDLLRHLFRYDEARILTHRLETIGRPLKLALFMRVLSRGHCFVEDEGGRRRACCFGNRQASDGDACTIHHISGRQRVSSGEGLVSASGN